MQAFSGIALAAAVLLVAAGAPKVVRPADTVGALRTVGVTVPLVTGRLVGAVEVAVGAGVVAAGSAGWLAAEAALYLGFTAFVIVALRRGGAVASCGCAGRPDMPPTVPHAVLTATLATGSALAAAAGPGAVDPLTFAAGALVAWLGWLVMTQLPAVLRPVGRGRP